MTQTQTQTQSGAQPQPQSVNAPAPVSYWDAADAEARPREAIVMRHCAEQAEQEERDAMFTAEVSGGPSLMERAAGPLLFVLAAFIAAGLIVAGGRWAGWVH